MCHVLQCLSERACVLPRFFCFAIPGKFGSACQRLFHQTRAGSASSIALSSLLSFSETWWKQKKRYFSSDLWKVAHDHIHRRCQPLKKLSHPCLHPVASRVGTFSWFEEWTANSEFTYTHFSLQVSEHWLARLSNMRIDLYSSLANDLEEKCSFIGHCSISFIWWA